jgi:hypothetical protein
LRRSEQQTWIPFEPSDVVPVRQAGSEIWGHQKVKQGFGPIRESIGESLDQLRRAVLKPKKLHDAGSREHALGGSREAEGRFVIFLGEIAKVERISPDELAVLGLREHVVNEGARQRAAGVAERIHREKAKALFTQKKVDAGKGVGVWSKRALKHALHVDRQDGVFDGLAGAEQNLHVRAFCIDL